MMQKLILSKELKKRIKKIDHEIARKLLTTKKVDDSLPGYINYLGISHDNKDYISYMTLDRINRYGTDFQPKEIELPEYKGFLQIKLAKRYQLSSITGIDDHLGIRDFITLVSPEQLKEPYNTRRSYDYIFLDKYGKLIRTYNTYLHYTVKYLSSEIIEKLTYIEDRDPIWEPTNRFHAKAGKTLRKLFNNLFNDKQWEEFSNLYKSVAIQECGQYKYEELSGEDIRWAYLYNNYSGNGRSGELGSSCMRGMGSQSYFDIYCHNSKQVGLAVFKNKENKIACRTLLWRGVKNDEKSVYFDRCYGISTPIQKRMVDHLSSMGYKDLFKIKGGKDRFNSNQELELEIGTETIKKFPYMDSFRYITGKTLSIQPGDWQLASTSGGYTILNKSVKIELEVQDEESGGYCDNCETWENDNNLYRIDFGNHRGEFMCCNCSSYSDYHEGQIADSDSHYVNYLDTSVLTSECLLDYKEDWILSTDAITLYNGKFAYQEDPKLMHTFDNEYFIQGDDNFIEVEGEWINKSQLKLQENEL